MQFKGVNNEERLRSWGQQSLACACSVAGYINHVIHWCVQFFFVRGSVSHFLPLPAPPRLCWLFLHCCFFSVTGACFFPFVLGLMAG